MSIYRLPKLFDRNCDLKKRWYVGYFFKHPETNEFKLFQIWISNKFNTKQSRYKEASIIIETWSNKLKGGFNPFADQDKKLKTISESVEFILILKEKSTKKRTYQTYKSILKLFRNWLKELKYINMPIDYFNKNHAQEFFDYLLTKDIKGRTYNNTLSAMRTIFNELLSREYIIRNPFALVKTIQQIEPNINSYSIKELKAMQEHISKTNSGLWLFCEFVFYCGIRPAELVLVKISDIDLNKGQIVIQASNSKNNKSQIVEFPEPLFKSLLGKNLQSYPEDYYLFSKEGKIGSIKVSPVRYSEMFRKEANYLKLPISKKLYDLKHTGAGMVIENGANINDVRLHLRHSDLQITHQYINRFKSSVGKDFLQKFPDLNKI